MISGGNATVFVSNMEPMWSFVFNVQYRKRVLSVRSSIFTIRGTTTFRHGSGMATNRRERFDLSIQADSLREERESVQWTWA
jgi:hypothetical protein